MKKFSNLVTPKALNVNNPVQGVAAARGKESRHPHQNSVGVQHLYATCCAPTEHRVSTLHRPTPSCGYRLARGYSHCTPSACRQNLKKTYSISMIYKIIST
ncbi:MAG: hypothetical protein FWD09_04030 [Lentimicrobiaceae bacterium]|nr:hypothetical protein [Lentimicrobiaceae bacterium]